MKIAIGQTEVLPKDIEANLKNILQAVNSAKKSGADILILPKSAITGRFIGNIREAQSFIRETNLAKEKIIAEAGKLEIVFSDCESSAEHKNIKIGYIEGDYTSLLKDADIFVFAENEPFETGLYNRRKTALSKFAKEHEKPVFYINKISSENEGKNVYVYTGKSAAFNPDGSAALFLSDTRSEIGVYDIKYPTKVKDDNPSNTREIFTALRVGIKYFLKTVGIKRVVIGISGGIDSAVATALYGRILPPEDILLVNLPSRFNSAATKNLAEILAKNIGANYAVFPIENCVNMTAEEIPNTPVTFLKTGEQFNLDLTSFDMENVQARDRGSRLLAALSAAFSHKKGEKKAAAFTCNGNKTECTAGYATLYGDGAGFLAAIADLWKYQVYELAHFLNEEEYKREVIPQGIIDIVPSAELSDAQNVEEGKGDPLFYPYHDFLLRAFVEKTPKITAEEILTWYAENTLEENIGCKKGIIKEHFKTNAEFIADLERWWQQFNGLSTAKRIQSPPIIKISARPFGNGFNESQGKIFYTTKYFELKEKLLQED